MVSCMQLLVPPVTFVVDGWIPTTTTIITSTSGRRLSFSSRGRLMLLHLVAAPSPKSQLCPPKRRKLHRRQGCLARRTTIFRRTSGTQHYDMMSNNYGKWQWKSIRFLPTNTTTKFLFALFMPAFSPLEALNALNM